MLRQSRVSSKYIVRQINGITVSKISSSICKDTLYSICSMKRIVSLTLIPYRLIFTKNNQGVGFFRQI